MEKQGLGEVLSCYTAAPRGGFLTLFFPLLILLPLKACRPALCFAVLSPWQAVTLCRVNPFGTVFPTAQASLFLKIHLSLPTSKLPTQRMCVTGSRPWAALLLLEQNSCQAVWALAMQAGDAPAKPADDRIAL